MKGFLALTAAACGAALLFAAAGSAKPPDHWTDFGTYSGSTSCGGFNDVYQGSVVSSGMTTYDKAGNPVTDIVHQTRVETNSRSDDPSASITATGSWTVHYDYATGSETDTGQVYKQTFPGLGLLFHDVGKIVFSATGTVVHGPHDVFDQGDGAFCGALEAIG